MKRLNKAEAEEIARLAATSGIDFYNMNVRCLPLADKRKVHKYMEKYCHLADNHIAMTMRSEDPMVDLDRYIQDEMCRQISED